MSKWNSLNKKGPQSAFKIHTQEPGTWRAVLLDQHGGIHTLTAPTAQELYEQLAKLGAEDETAIQYTTPTQWRDVVQAVRLWGSAHVETGYDCDYVVTRQRP